MTGAAPIATTALAFPEGELNEFHIGSEDGSIYQVVASRVSRTHYLVTLFLRLTGYTVVNMSGVQRNSYVCSRQCSKCASHPSLRPSVTVPKRALTSATRGTLVQ